MEMGNGVNQCRLFDHPCGYGLLLDRGGCACNFIILPFEFLHCSCWSLNIGAFSNYLTVNQFYLFLCLQHSHLHTPSLPNLPTI